MILIPIASELTACHMILQIIGLSLHIMELLFLKREPTLLGASSLSTKFLSNIVLGQRDESNTYAEDITRLNIWGKLCQKSSFK